MSIEHIEEDRPLARLVAGEVQDDGASALHKKGQFWSHASGPTFWESWDMGM